MVLVPDVCNNVLESYICVIYITLVIICLVVNHRIESYMFKVFIYL